MNINNNSNYVPPIIEKVYNIQGSTAAQGSGEYHRYRALRRRERTIAAAMEKEFKRSIVVFEEHFKEFRKTLPRNEIQSSWIFERKWEVLSMIIDAFFPRFHYNTIIDNENYKILSNNINSKDNKYRVYYNLMGNDYDHFKMEKNEVWFSDEDEDYLKTKRIKMKIFDENAIEYRVTTNGIEYTYKYRDTSNFFNKILHE